MTRPLLPREQKLLIGMILLLFGVAGWFLALVPLYRSWQEKIQESQIQQHRLNENLKIIARKDWIEKRYQELTQPLKATGSDEQEIGRLQDAIGALAKQTGVKVNKTKPRPMESREHFKRCLVELDCEGTMIQMADFIYRMQLSPQVLRVEQLRLSLEREKDAALRAALLVTKVLILED